MLSTDTPTPDGGETPKKTRASGAAYLHGRLPQIVEMLTGDAATAWDEVGRLQDELERAGKSERQPDDAEQLARHKVALAHAEKTIIGLHARVAELEAAAKRKPVLKASPRHAQRAARH